MAHASTEAEYLKWLSNLVVSDAEQSGAISQSSAPFHSHMGLSNNTISQNLLISFCYAWLIEQKLFLLDHIIDFREEPAQL